MNYTIISIEDNELANDEVWDVFDRKCTASLSSAERNIAVYLRAEMGSGLPLLDWLETWHEKFQKKNKAFHIIAEDLRQIESIELSNPDQNLVFFSSVNAYEEYIKGVVPDLKENDGKKSEEKPPKKLDDLQNRPTEEAKAPVLSTGDTVIIAGEYTCLGCGVSRMWIKGKKASACENPECFAPSKGWKLSFDLF